MSAAANPFDQLLNHAAAVSQAASAVAARQAAAGMRPGMSKVEQLLELLDQNGPMSTVELGRVVGLESRLIWGLLKEPQKRGQVLRFGAERLWALNRAWGQAAGDEIAAAARLLRRAGWTVIEPGENA